MVRLRYFILGAACIFACSRTVEHLRSRSAPLVVLDGDGNFGTVPVTTLSDPHTITVRPAPPANSLQFDVIESIESTCPEFEVTAPGAAGAVVQRFCLAFEGGTYGTGELTCVAFEEQIFTFQVNFRPTLELPTSDQCRIIVRLDGGSSRSIPVSGIGDAPPLRAQFSTTAPINFFTVNQTKTSVQSKIVVTNTGSQTLSVAATVVNDQNVFLVNGTPVNGAVGSQDLARNASRELAIQCRPEVGVTSPKPYSGSITITTNDPVAARMSVTIPIDCTGIESAIDATVLVSEVTTRVGQAVEMEIDLENISTVAGSFATFGVIELAPSAAPGLEIVSAPTLNTSLQQGSKTKMRLRWTPPVVHVGGLGSVLLRVNGETDHEIFVGSGQAQLADVTSSVPNTEKFDFGKMCLGESRTRKLTMKPAGTDVMLFADYTVTGVSIPAPFTAEVVAGPSLVKVFPPSEVTLSVTAQPMDTEGRFDAMLAVATDSPTEPTYGVPVTVEVLPQGATVSPAQLDFNTTIVTGFSETRTAVFRNCTDAAIDIAGILLDGNSAPDFDILSIVTRDQNQQDVEQNPPFSLPRNGEIVVAVQMLPQTDGLKSAQVSIDFQELGKPDTSNQTVALTGEAFLRSIADTRDSYYRCSSGSPVHALPLVFVGAWLVVVRRRRRRR